MIARTMKAALVVAVVAALAPRLARGVEGKPMPEVRPGSPDTTDVIYSSAVAQSRIASDKALGEHALHNTRLGAQGTSVGFAAKSPEAKFFLAGTYYSEALALAGSGQSAEAARRMDAVERILLDLGSPNGLYAYVSRARHHLVRGDLAREALLDYLSLFQPLFSDYAKGQSADKLSLFMAGAWVSDMGLAAAAGDITLLRQSPELKRIMADMKRMDAPKGVQDALADIGGVGAQKDVAERDAKRVLGLVQRIQTLLG